MAELAPRHSWKHLEADIGGFVGAEAWLGKLINFKSQKRPPHPPAGKLQGEVVIFTGVRYERGTPGQPSSGNTPVRPKRKRV